nr:hypothetical protein [Tanacetum cinerariifolium]
MAISISSVSSNSLEESVGTSTGRVILFGTIPTTIPDTTLSMTPHATHINATPISIVSSTIPPSLDYTPTSPDYTPASPDYSPASDTKTDPLEDLSSDHIQPLPATSPFLSSTDDSLGNDIPDTPPSPTHGTPLTKTTLFTHRSPATSGLFRCRVMVLAPWQPIPHGRSYRYHLNRLVHMMTARKRVGPSPTHRLAMRHSVNYSSLDHFSSDHSLRDTSSSSSSSSSSETSSDPSSDDLSDSSSDHSLPAPSSGMRSSHHLCSLVLSIPRSSTAIIDRPSYDSSSTSPSRKRSRSFAASVPLPSPIHGALSYTRAELLPSPKRIRSSEFDTKLEVSSEDSFEPYVPRVTDLEMNVDMKRSDGIEIDPEIQAEIDESEIKTGARGPVEVRVDRVTHSVIADNIPKPAQVEGAIEAIEGIQRDQGHRIVAIGQQSTDMLERIKELEQVYMRLRDIMHVAIQRVTQSQRRGTMPNTRSRVTMTRKAVNKQSDYRLAGALGARDAA